MLNVYFFITDDTLKMENVDSENEFSIKSLEKYRIKKVSVRVTDILSSPSGIKDNYMKSLSERDLVLNPKSMRSTKSKVLTDVDNLVTGSASTKNILSPRSVAKKQKHVRKGDIIVEKTDKENDENVHSEINGCSSSLLMFVDSSGEDITNAVIEVSSPDKRKNSNRHDDEGKENFSMEVCVEKETSINQLEGVDLKSKPKPVENNFSESETDSQIGDDLVPDTDPEDQLISKQPSDNSTIKGKF